jgi:uncharacterized membrane protein YfcA
VPEIEIVAFLVVASGLAGFVDAVAGGGGLILMPALLLGLPASTPIPTILGTNKFAAATGTSAAAYQFLKADLVGWRDLLGPVLAAMAGSAVGAHYAYQVDPAILRPLMVALLAGMLVFTLVRPDHGRLHAPRFGPGARRSLSVLIALCLGFYDGIFGPGTGTLLIFLNVGVLGYDFLRSSALAKAANWGSNIAALTLFVWNGSWLPELALVLAVANLVGGRVGARLAIGKGNAWIRWIFVGVVTVLLARLAWQVATGI